HLSHSSHLRVESHPRRPVLLPALPSALTLALAPSLVVHHDHRSSSAHVLELACCRAQFDFSFCVCSRCHFDHGHGRPARRHAWNTGSTVSACPRLPNGHHRFHAAIHHHLVADVHFVSFRAGSRCGFQLDTATRPHDAPVLLPVPAHTPLELAGK